MAYYGLKDLTAAYVGAYNLTSFTGGARMKATTQLDIRQFAGNAFPTALDTGVKSGEVELSDVIYDSVANIAFGPLPTSAVPVSLLHEGGTASSRFYGFQSAVVSGVEVELSPDKMDGIIPTLTVSGEVNQGYVVAPPVSRSTAGNTDTTYADMGAASATGGHAFLHLPVLTLGGYTNVIVTVRHSTDHITFVNHTSFTAATVPTSQVIALAGTINRYLSIGWAWTGAGSGQSFTAFVGVAVD